MCSVLLGDYAPIDTSDGCGMNLLDIKSFKWSPVLAGATAPGVEGKLGPVAAAHEVVGNISSYFTGAYGFNPSCKVIAWSGDNPNSVAGLGLRAPGDIAISLGTSDTMFGITSSPTPGIEGHIFANPVDPKSYMAMLCYKNGSLTRERVRDAAAGGSWDKFNAMLSSETKAGNGGNIGFYIDAPEITPALKAGVRRFAPEGGKHRRVSSFANAVDVRAVVEGQFMSMRVHGESVGLTSPKRIIATGGASGNAAITQVIADVFGAPVFVASRTDSASLGAAYRALHAWTCADRKSFVPFEEVTGSAIAADLRLAASPRADAHAAYTALLPAYKQCEASVLAE
jgi:xylulokinase